jgi:hypothetical protein
MPQEIKIAELTTNMPAAASNSGFPDPPEPNE